MGQKEVLLIIPAYNEEKTIGKVMDQLAQPEISDIVDVLVMEADCSLAINMPFAVGTST